MTAPWLWRHLLLRALCWLDACLQHAAVALLRRRGMRRPGRLPTAFWQLSGWLARAIHALAAGL